MQRNVTIFTETDFSFWLRLKRGGTEMECLQRFQAVDTKNSERKGPGQARFLKSALGAKRVHVHTVNYKWNVSKLRAPFLGVGIPL